MVAVIALWTRAHWATALTYYWGLTLNPQAILTPALDSPDFPHIDFIDQALDRGQIDLRWREADGTVRSGELRFYVHFAKPGALELGLVRSPVTETTTNPVTIRAMPDGRATHLAETITDLDWREVAIFAPPAVCQGSLKPAPPFCPNTLPIGSLKLS